MDTYLRETEMLDYSNPSIRALIQEKNWRTLDTFERIKSIYNFVRDDIHFGYNIDDNISASKVLKDGYGQCNTKATLFMALLRACGIPCRIHGFTIDKKLQQGAMTGFVYRNAPKNIFHSWVEVYFEERWYELEALILDTQYLTKLQAMHKTCTGAFCGYGVYDSPDELLKEHHQQMSPLKRFAYRHIGRHLMNRNIKKIRNA